MKSDRPIVIVDAMNLFVRSYAAYPTMSTHGYQMGGAIGFLKSLRRIVDMAKPRAIYIAWEGGGSAKRRKLYSEYKLGRRPEKLNRFYEDDIPDSEENRKHQIIALLGLLKHTPMCQIYVQDCEGDDVIAYLCRGPFREVDKIIVSSDKDLYQLLDAKTKNYSLHKKIFVTAADVFEEFRVSAENFAIAKALCGDASDNIPGIKGLGFKKLAKLFPLLGTESGLVLQDVLNFAASHIDESAIFKRVVESEADIRRNWNLVYLDGSMLSPTQAQRVDHVLSTYVPRISRFGFMRKLIEEGINDLSVEDFFYTFTCLENVENV